MATTSSNSKKGFFFTIMAFALLSFMLLTAQVWVRTFEQSDQRASQRFKGEAMRLVLFTISDRAMSDFANASAFHATYRLADFTATLGNGLGPEDSLDPNNPKTGKVEKTLYALMYNGTSGYLSGNNGITYNADEVERYTVASWQGKIQKAANVMGFNTSFSNMTNFTIKQENAWNVSVYFEMDMNISDLEGTMWQSKRLHANSSFPINGFLDPSITRGDMRYRNKDRNTSAEKQIFSHAVYKVPSDVSPVKLPDAVEGTGWFYGAITDQYPDEMNASELGKLSQYVLVDQFNPRLVQYADFYGAVVVTSLPGEQIDVYTEGSCTYNRTTQTNCLNCLRYYSTNQPGCGPLSPVLLAENKTEQAKAVAVTNGNGWLQNITPVVRTGMQPDSQRFVLIDNQYDDPLMKRSGEHRLWDINRLRDMAICGFYLQSDKAPSFFQRMLEYPYSVPHTALGIETFLVGKWAGGADDLNSNGDLYSRLDWEFYNNPSASGNQVIKGMMGCKYKEMCSGQNATKEGVGKFRLSSDGVSRYVLGEITCNRFSGSCG